MKRTNPKRLDFKSFYLGPKQEMHLTWPLGKPCTYIAKTFHTLVLTLCEMWSAISECIVTHFYHSVFSSARRIS
jgi:hypothetical protein